MALKRRQSADIERVEAPFPAKAQALAALGDRRAQDWDLSGYSMTRVMKPWRLRRRSAVHWASRWVACMDATRHRPSSPLMKTLYWMLVDVVS
jgi:hypothetical protein